MKDFILEGTQNTPKIRFVSETNSGEIQGACYPENASAFFNPMIDWLEEFRKQSPKSFIIDIRLDYFNTSASKCLLDMFLNFEDMKKEGCDLKVRWHYCEDDEDIFESGEEFAEDIDIEFEFVAY